MTKCNRCGEPLPQMEVSTRLGRGRSLRCQRCRGLATRVCIRCGGPFEGKPGARLCSPACRRAHRPQTFKTCPQCGCRFGPVSHLSRRFCSIRCKGRAQATGRKVVHKPHRKARSAQSLVRYHVLAGNIVKPAACETCGKTGRLEAAHFDYDEPLRVQWLCTRCHRIWDSREPKGGTYRVVVDPQTGQPLPDGQAEGAESGS